jgi:polysaccharide pyruvyl transferase WcaK-like protein
MFGLFGIGNFGNEATLVAAYEAARRVLPSARITTICTDPVRVERQHGIPGVPINPGGRWKRLAGGGRARRLLVQPVLEVGRWVVAVRHLRHVDLMVVPGTGILDDFGQTPAQLPLGIARWSIAAKIAGARLVYLSVGAGPINHPASRFLMKLALAQADFCSYRDEGSRQFMASIGRSTAADEIWPDLVFALERLLDKPRRDTDSFTVALGVMDYRGWRGFGADAGVIYADYIERLAALANALRAAGYRLFLVLGDDADLPAAHAVAERLHDGEVDIVPSADFDDVRTAVMESDVLISSRYHNLIAALMAGVPAVSLSYARKNDQLLEAFGLGEYCQSIESFDLGRVLADVASIRADHAALGAEIERRLKTTRAELRSLLDRQLLPTSSTTASPSQ